MPKTNQVIAWHVPTPEMAGSDAAYRQLAQVWKRSWQRNGWDAAVVGQNIAGSHPFYRIIKDKVRNYPTHNGKNYETGCWVRWAAAAQAAKRLNAPVVMSDTDVINYSLKPEDVADLPGDIHVLDRFGVPCLVYLTPKGAQRLVEMIVANNLPPNTNHWSDMLFFIEVLLKQGKITHDPWLCYAYGDDNFPDWKNAKALHFSASSCRGQGVTKLQTVLSHVQNGVKAS